MRIVQDITVATLLGGQVELPTHVYTRRNCNFNIDCSEHFFLGPSLWEVYDLELTLTKLRIAGVSVSRNISKGKLQMVPTMWPVAATQITETKRAFQFISRFGTSSFGPTDNDCCTKFIPDTVKAVELLKNVNHAFQSAQKFRVVAAKVLGSFKEKTQQNSVVTMHWRLEEDFTKAKGHSLSIETYCRAILHEITLAQERLFDRWSKIHILVLGETEVESIAKILESCNERRILYQIHSKETLLKKNINLLSDENTDVKGQLDFELGVQSDFFLGSPFSSFSVLIAFYRFGSPTYRPELTVMATVDTADKLALIFQMQFPYSPHFVANTTKCTLISKVIPRYRQALHSCVLQERINLLQTHGTLLT
eukprot:CAMPEP_0201491010 /NCGR_PEP_ID=MMETSP0151_2-20130828/28294_1 /ASSEMBLY_ACC=CAM_ASM_000257 /TAXON_ID=200890 /ORGANISM="Paramoeba atlantica, Strain 621/1 / CCAP 1560/9" /LENGTH=365 /DNA_ID=CAMNT_0047877197 /DNA_START=200 /DNA_END=1297 /DNA_ORIENTATION=+